MVATEMLANRDSATFSDCTFRITPVARFIAYSAFASTIAWCIVVALAFLAFQAKFRETEGSSSRMRRFLLLYVVVMALASTVSLVETLVETHQLLFSTLVCGPTSTNPSPNSPSIQVVALGKTPLPLVTPFIIFSADSLMLWRCWVLFRTVGRPIRVAISSLLILLILATLASSILAFIGGWSLAIFAFLPVTVGSNIIISGLVIGRLLYHERSTKKIMGTQDRVSPFRRVIHICVESSALISICGVFAMSLSLPGDLNLASISLIPSITLGHICVISALLIILRVANGRSATTVVASIPIDVRGSVNTMAFATRSRSTTVSTSEGYPYIKRNSGDPPASTVNDKS